MAARNTDVVNVAQLLDLAVRARNRTADVANTCATLLGSKEDSNNKTTNITSASTDNQYPSAKAVWELFNSITDANEVSY